MTSKRSNLGSTHRREEGETTGQISIKRLSTRDNLWIASPLLLLGRTKRAKRPRNRKWKCNKNIVQLNKQTTKNFVTSVLNVHYKKICKPNFAECHVNFKVTV